jgi:hypothetical protein
MPELLSLVAAPGCSRVGSQWDRCGAYYVEPIEGGGWIDCRDLGQVFEHEGPLPQPEKLEKTTMG